MKLRLLLSALALMLSFNAAYASFPVKRTAVTTQNSVTQDVTEEVYEAVPAASGQKDKWVAAALWLVLGGFAAHRWYIGSPWYWNVLYILTLGFFLVGHIIDIVQILTDSYPGL
ncbi:TM2 domain-containing protein [Winogradskyella maritima]|uniref:TM2 domain-containing protein n=1 Tax=Winogradskyella maritima TaxID=1517766 RepID=A0ABV8AHU0_9FLAO|nr:TM2 domain-containing protein [Winogradskyella maritima]